MNKTINTQCQRFGVRKLLPIIILVAILLISVAIILLANGQGSISANAHLDEEILFQNELLLEEDDFEPYVRIHTYCGEIEIEPFVVELEESQPMMSGPLPSPLRQRIYGQGRPLNTSIVVVFLAHGFAGNMGTWPNPAGPNNTTGAPGTFLWYARDAALFMLDFHPFNLYRDRMIVYAIMSTTIRVNRNPATGPLTSHTLGSNGVSHVREFASDVSNNVRFMQVLSNSQNHHYGSANTIRRNPTGTNDSNVAITSTGVFHGAWTGGGSAWTGSWGTVVHEFGHSFGGVRDERASSSDAIYSRHEDNIPNIVRMRYADFVAGNFAGLRWNTWRSFDTRTARNNPSNTWSIEARLLERVDWPSNRINPNGAYVWVSPYATCIMISTRSSWQALRARGKCKEDLHFCAVCTEEIIRRMQLTINVNLFNTSTTGLGTNEIAITGVNVNARGYFRIPTIINGRRVVEIRQSAFANQRYVTEYILPETLRIIGPSAFAGNTILSTITLPSTITYIGAMAFMETTLESIGIPSFVTHIAHSAFYGSSLRNVSFGVGTTPLRIDHNAFSSTMLTAITLPNRLQSIGQNVFLHTPLWNSQPGTVYAGGWLVDRRDNTPATYAIRGGTRGLADGVFNNQTQLTNLTLPYSLAFIGFRAIAGTSITSISLPGHLQLISAEAFANNSQLSLVRAYGTRYSAIPVFGDGLAAFRNTPNNLQVVVPLCSIESYRRAFAPSGLLSQQIVPDTSFFIDHHRTIVAQLSQGSHTTLQLSFSTISDMGVTVQFLTPAQVYARMYNGIGHFVTSITGDASATLRLSRHNYTLILINNSSSEQLVSLQIDVATYFAYNIIAHGHTTVAGGSIYLNVLPSQLQHRAIAVGYRNSLSFSNNNVSPVTIYTTMSGDSLFSMPTGGTITRTLPNATRLIFAWNNTHTALRVDANPRDQDFWQVRLYTANQYTLLCPPYTLPTGLSAQLGQRLISVNLPTGWNWNNPSALVESAGSRGHIATFRHSNPRYQMVMRFVTINIAQPLRTPAYTLPTGLSGIEGNYLYSVDLSSPQLLGRWEWAEPNAVLYLLRLWPLNYGYDCYYYTVKASRDLSLWIDRPIVPPMRYSQIRRHRARFVPNDIGRYYVVYRILEIRVYEPIIDPIDPCPPIIPSVVRLFNGSLSNTRSINISPLAWDIDIFTLSYVRIVVTGDFIVDRVVRIYPALFVVTDSTPYFTTEYIDMATGFGCAVRVSIASDNFSRTIRVSINSFKVQSWLANVRVYKV